MTRTRLMTMALALVFGGALAWLWLLPAERASMVRALDNLDQNVRNRAWSRLLAAPAHGEPARAAALLPQINEQLVAAGDDALLHASVELRHAGLWGWEYQDRHLLLRELGVRAGSDEPGRQQPAVDLLSDCPLDLQPEALLPIVARLLNSTSARVRRGAFESTCAWAGRERAILLAELPVPQDDTELRRMHELALSWDRRGELTGNVDGNAPIGVLEAALLRATIADPEDAAPVLTAIDEWDAKAPPAFEYILRFSDDPRAFERLTRMEDDGNAVASFALQARRPEIDQRPARRVVANREAPLHVRRLAAWRLDDLDPDALDELLIVESERDRPDAYPLVMLAEKHLDAAGAARLAERWIRSFDDHEKRAGALLAAMSGTHRDLLREAYDIENQPAVRTTQRLALWALGSFPGGNDPVEFAHRVLHRDDGSMRPDIVLAMLLAGHSTAIEHLASRSAIGSADAVQWRAWMIERFLPVWHQEIGRPIGGDPRAIMLHFDRLETLRLLEQRRLRFDSDRRIYTASS